MNRRNMMLSLSGAVAGSALLALPRAAVAQTMPSQTMPSQTMPSAINAAPSPDVTPVPGSVIDEQTYITDTLTLGSFSRTASELAAMRASNPKVREFARFEVAEQTTMAQVITNNSAPPPAPLYGLDADQVLALRNTPTDRFDVAYVDAQISAHARLRAVQQAYLNTERGDHNMAHIAALARTVIEMHQTMLADLRNTLAA